jgi:hypothetical protein
VVDIDAQINGIHTADPAYKVLRVRKVNTSRRPVQLAVPEEASDHWQLAAGQNRIDVSAPLCRLL